MMLLIYKPRRIQIITGIRSGLFRIVCDYVISKYVISKTSRLSRQGEPKSTCRQKTT